ncbi:outer membrane lipoprotein-sorting protein [Pleionea mediterranea]|uniref:Outer membrane lipoprotein-sorting protein n=1 Tax=Pleionea mediterranea TaxID=523701 RepID=A0A316FZ81_9GAMM|nr:outer membrane lipoprotein-sorting protein [Pleionea mediterranea]PWK53879.1 outer membrane lipoprotein-sorting protein [Pleionea mediterranea]
MYSSNTLLTLVLLIFCSNLTANQSTKQNTEKSTAKSAEQIMERNFYAGKVSKIKKQITMKLINHRSEERVRKVIVTSALQDNGIDSYMLVRFLKPKDIQGTGFLQHEHSKAEDDLWIFLPALDRSRRLIASNKKDSFMGTDFAYGDMLPPRVSYYHHKLIGEAVVDGVDCFLIESTPINQTIKDNYGYTSKKTWIDKKSFHEVKVEYYDLDKQLLKTQRVSGIKLVEPENDRYAAMRREMNNHQTGHKTIVEATHYETDVKLDQHTFTVRTLEWF